MCPCRAYYGWVFCFVSFFVRYLGFGILGYLCLLRDYTFPAKKKKEKKAFVKGSAGAHQTRVLVYLVKTAWTLDFCAAKGKTHGLAS